MSTSGDVFDYLFRVVLIGDSGVGKTSVVTRFTRGTFVEGQCSSFGVDFARKTLIIDDQQIKLQIWDTAGQERFRTITQSYYRNANGVILAYDITKYESWEGLPQWLDDLGRYAPPNVLTFLIGTKKDLESKREVSKEQAKTFASKHSNVVGVIETSAKDAINIDKVFEKLARALKDRYEGPPPSFSNSLRVVEVSPKKRFSNLCDLERCCNN